MQVHCPQCRAECTIDVGKEASVTCPSCGFSISTARLTGEGGEADMDNVPPTMSLDQPPSMPGRDEGEGLTAAPLPTAGEPALPIRWIGRYRIVRYIASGSFGDVYEAFDSKLERAVAIKVPRRAKFESDERFQRFLQSFAAEGRRAAQLSHPGIVRVYDVEFDEQTHAVYIVMELVDGASLDHHLRSERPSVAQVVDWVAQVADAVHVAHKQGFVHRDLKPGNILIDSAGRARVVDFGLALHENEQRRYKGQVAGTLAYMSPEQVLGRTEFLDGRTDIWSLGAILYRALTGRVPFAGSDREQRDQILEREPKPFSQINDLLPRELEQICLKGCLVKAVADRLPSARDLRDALVTWLDENRSTAKLVAVAAGAAATATDSTHPDSSGPRAGSTHHSAAQQSAPVMHPRWWRRAAIATVVGLVTLVAAYGIGGRWLRPDTLIRRLLEIPLFDRQATVNRPQDLLLRPPVELLWPSAEPHTASWNETERTLFVQSEGSACLALGQTFAEDFQLEIEFQKASWEGFSGLFLGLSTDGPNSDPEADWISGRALAPGPWAFQGIGFDKAPGVARRVQRLIRELDLTDQGFDYRQHIQLTPEDVELGARRQRLVIVVAEGRVEEVVFNDKRLNEITTSKAVDEGAARRCRGFFGILNYGGSVVVTRAEFKLLKPRDAKP